jgi:hypothetical protein
MVIRLAVDALAGGDVTPKLQWTSGSEAAVPLADRRKAFWKVNSPLPSVVLLVSTRGASNQTRKVIDDNDGFCARSIFPRAALEEGRGSP